MGHTHESILPCTTQQGGLLLMICIVDGMGFMRTDGLRFVSCRNCGLAIGRLLRSQGFGCQCYRHDPRPLIVSFARSTLMVASLKLESLHWLAALFVYN
jgi:hypothetical protein